MNYEVMEKLIAIPMGLIIGLHSCFLYAYLVRRAELTWQRVLPFLALIIQIPYERYYLSPEVSINVPIRVDLLLIIPLTIVALTLSVRSIFTGSSK